MRSKDEVREIIARLNDRMAEIFPDEQMDVILFGSYARSDADDGSDIDVMFLVDAPRRSIMEKQWRIGEIAADVLMDSGAVVFPRKCRCDALFQECAPGRGGDSWMRLR